MSAGRESDLGDRKAAPARAGPVLNLPDEFEPERLDALKNVLARVLAARALHAMRKEPANDD